MSNIINKSNVLGEFNILMMVFGKLGPRDVAMGSLVCKRWNACLNQKSNKDGKSLYDRNKEVVEGLWNTIERSEQAILDSWRDCCRGYGKEVERKAWRTHLVRKESIVGPHSAWIFCGFSRPTSEGGHWSPLPKIQNSLEFYKANLLLCIHQVKKLYVEVCEEYIITATLIAIRLYLNGNKEVSDVEIFLSQIRSLLTNDIINDIKQGLCNYEKRDRELKEYNQVKESLFQLLDSFQSSL